MFWKLLRRHGGSNFEVCNNLVVNGQSYNDSNVVNGFFQHFYGVFGSNLPEDEISAEHEQELRRYASQPSSLFNHFLLDSFELTELDRAIGS